MMLFQAKPSASFRQAVACLATVICLCRAVPVEVTTTSTDYTASAVAHSSLNSPVSLVSTHAFTTNAPASESDWTSTVYTQSPSSIQTIENGDSTAVSETEHGGISNTPEPNVYMSENFPLDKTLPWNETGLQALENLIEQPSRSDRAFSARDTYITLLNATPYRWRRGYTHSYQMRDWDKLWPDYIRSGESAVRFAITLLDGSFHDSAAEVVYHLEGTSKPMSFMLQYRPHNSTRILFLEDLETLHNAKDSSHNLGWYRWPGGVGFVIAGKEGNFISNDPPLDWMQSMLPEIGHLSLREIVLPGSHHAGLWKTVHTHGFARQYNTQTQDINLYHQLGNGGVRVLDARPVKFRGKFREGHGSMTGSFWSGGLGAELTQMVYQTNQFNRDFPGELIIWDLHCDEIKDLDWHKQKTENGAPSDAAIEHLFEILQTLEHRINIPENEDVSRWPLHDIIGNKTSAVLIRVSEEFAKKKGYPGGKGGFTTDAEFPISHRWSNTKTENSMEEDQAEALKYTDRHGYVHSMDWLLTQELLDAILGMGPNIRDMGQASWASLFSEVWAMSTDESYPNWINMDVIHGNEQKTFAMTLNKCLAAKNCGSLGGKVQIED